MLHRDAAAAAVAAAFAWSEPAGILAAQNGHSDVAACLIVCGADPEARDNVFSDTPWRTAGRNNHEEALRRALSVAVPACEASRCNHRPVALLSRFVVASQALLLLPVRARPDFMQVPREQPFHSRDPSLFGK